jgi:hypothetical protein
MFESLPMNHLMQLWLPENVPSLFQSAAGQSILTAQSGLRYGSEFPTATL